MATPAAILGILVKADTASANLALAKTNSELNKVHSSGTTATKTTSKLGTASSKASGFLRSAAVSAGGAALAYVSIAAAKDAITTTEDLAKATISLHKNLGLSTKSASEWAAVARTRGVDSTKLGMAFKTLATQLVSARDGSATAIKQFKKLGLSEDEIAKASHDTNFAVGAVSDGLKALPGGADKAAISGKLFGRGWQTITPILRDGSKEMQNQLDLANQYGATFGGKTIKSVKDLIAAQRELQIAQLGLQITFTEKLAPALTKGALAFAGFLNDMRKGKGTAGEIERALAAVAKTIRDVIQAFADMEKVTHVIETMGKTVAAFGSGIQHVVNLVSDLIHGRWSAAWNDAKGLVMDAVHIMLATLRAFTRPATAIFTGAWNAIKGIFTSGANAVISVINTIIDAINVIPGVDIGKVGAIGGTSKPQGNQGAGPGPHRHATGGIISKPTAIVGEEAPRHKEFVLATNPAYRDRNVGLWAQAGKELGVPGYGIGGVIGDVLGKVPSPGNIIGKVKDATGNLPGWMSGLGSYLISKVSKFVKDKIAGLFGGNQLAVTTGIPSLGGAIGSGSIAAIFAQVARALKAPAEAILALYEAGLAESGMQDLPGGDSSSQGVLQLLASTAAGLGVSPHDVPGVASLFLTQGFYGRGGAIALARAGLRPASSIAQAVQGSAFASGSNYAAQLGAAQAIMRSQGFHNIPEFGRGGVVPGPIGAPQMAIVHGGETISPPGGATVNIEHAEFGSMLEAHSFANKLAFRLAHA